MQGQAGPFAGCPPRSRSAAKMDGCSTTESGLPARYGEAPPGGASLVLRLAAGIGANSLRPNAVRDLLRAPAPAPLGGRQRAPAAPRRARADRDRRPRRLRLRLGGRAPLPRGVLALVGVGRVPARRLAAAQADRPGLRYPAAAARLSAPGPSGREGGDARPGLGRARRIR